MTRLTAIGCLASSTVILAAAGATVVFAIEPEGQGYNDRRVTPSSDAGAPEVFDPSKLPSDRAPSFPVRGPSHESHDRDGERAAQTPRRPDMPRVKEMPRVDDVKPMRQVERPSQERTSRSDRAQRGKALPVEAVPIEPEIDRVTPSTVELSQAGYARLGHDLTFDDEAPSVSLRVPRENMNLFLGSALLRGAGLSNPSLAFAGPDPAGQAGVIIEPGHLNRIEGLLGELRGHRIRLEPEGVSGIIIGMDPNADCDGSSCARIVLQLESGEIESFPLDEHVRVSFLEEQTRELVAEAINVMRARHDDRHRDIDLSVDIDEPDETYPADLTFLQRNDPWAASYRMTLDEGEDPTFQAWAVVENTSGVPWEDVELTLSTGPVNVIEGDLFEGARVARPDRARVGIESFSGRDMAESSMMASAPAVQVDANVEQTDGDISSQYTLGDRISLAPGSMKMLPILQEDVPDVRYSRYQAQGQTQRQGQHPDRVVRITNSLDVRLPEGVVSLSGDREGHMGDARIPALVPGEDHLARFGEDDALRVHEEVNDSLQRRQIEIAEGMVVTRESHERRSRYRIAPEGDGRESRILIEHPYRDDRWEVLEVVGAEMSRSETGGRMHWELTHDHDGAEPHDIVVRETRVSRSRIRIGDMSVDEILSWIDETPGEEFAEALAPYVTKLREVAAIENRRSRAAESRDNALEEQRRQLELMDSFPEESAEFERFAARAVEIEDEVGEYQNLIAELDEAIDRLEREAREILMSLELVVID